MSARVVDDGEFVQLHQLWAVPRSWWTRFRLREVEAWRGALRTR